MVESSLPAGHFAAGAFRGGRTFRRAWGIFWRHCIKYVTATTIVTSPLVYGAGSIWKVLAFTGVGLLSQAFVISGAFADVHGKPIGLSEWLKSGLRRIWAIVGLCMVWVAVMFGLMGIAGAFIVLGSRSGGPTSAPMWNGTGAGLLFAMGFLLYTIWFVAVPVCVLERLGPFGSLGRSRVLTKGYLWRLFGLQLRALIPFFLVGFFFFVGFVETFVARSWLTLALSLVWFAVLNAYAAVLTLVAYYDLRVAKDRALAPEIADVFE
jgi:hypothetical protein